MYPVWCQVKTCHGISLTNACCRAILCEVRERLQTQDASQHTSADIIPFVLRAIRFQWQQLYWQMPGEPPAAALDTNARGRDCLVQAGSAHLQLPDRFHPGRSEWTGLPWLRVNKALLGVRLYWPGLEAVPTWYTPVADNGSTIIIRDNTLIIKFQQDKKIQQIPLHRSVSIWRVKKLELTKCKS